MRAETYERRVILAFVMAIFIQINKDDLVFMLLGIAACFSYPVFILNVRRLMGAEDED